MELVGALRRGGLGVAYRERSPKPPLASPEPSKASPLKRGGRLSRLSQVIGSYRPFCPPERQVIEVIAGYRKLSSMFAPSKPSKASRALPKPSQSPESSSQGLQSSSQASEAPRRPPKPSAAVPSLQKASEAHSRPPKRCLSPLWPR